MSSVALGAYNTNNNNNSTAWLIIQISGQIARPDGLKFGPTSREVILLWPGSKVIGNIEFWPRSVDRAMNSASGVLVRSRPPNQAADSG